MARTQDTQTAGEFWEMVRSVADRLPKDLGRTGYHQQPGWFNRQIAELVKVERWSEAAWQLEQILTNGPLQLAGQPLKSPFADRRVQPTRKYPKGYQPNHVYDQVEVQWAYAKQHYDVELDKSHIPELVKSWDLAKYPKADGLYAFIKPAAWCRMKHWGNSQENILSGLVMDGPLRMLRSLGWSSTIFVSDYDANNYKVSDHTWRRLRCLESEQPGDFIVAPMQTGKLYVGQDAEDVRWQVGYAREPVQWACSSYEMASILFANSHRLGDETHLGIVCPGDVCYGSSWSPKTFYFGFQDGHIFHGKTHQANLVAITGPATGFGR